MRDARLNDIAFADDVYCFRLAWGELVELQEKTGCGPLFLLNRLIGGDWRVEDISNIIRLGLIGGGMEPVPAGKLTRRYVEGRPPLENHQLALLVLQAGIMGAPEEPVGESEAVNQTASSTTSQMDASDLPPSMELAPSSASRRRKSTK